MSKKRPLPSPEPATSPFAALAGLVKTTPVTETTAAPAPETKPPASRGRVDVLRNTAHRGGKTVTVLKGFADLDAAELQALARQLQKRCGAGGTVKAGAIEIQGDHRDTAMAVLTEVGFRPVRAGG